ncbi:MAG: glycosyltransferase family 4 protein [Leeuwenhoekiella sp.]
MKILIIGQVWPEPKSSAAGSRMLQLISVFKEMGAEIHFASAAAPGQNAADLSALNIQTHVIKLNDDSFDAFAKNLQPEAVMFDRFMIEEQYGWRVAENCPKAIRILDTEDLHGLRKGRELALKIGEAFTDKHLHNDTAKREIASIYRCDLSLIISEAEMDLLNKFFKVPEELLMYLPFMVDRISEAEVAKWPGFNQRKDFVTIGNFRHLPNWDAVQYLKKEIWPKIHTEIPDAKMHIYGSYPAEKHTQLHNPKENFLIHRWTEDAATAMMAAKVCLAPLRIGAGLKGKLLLAMQCGTPCVTTTLGAEGMHGKLPFNGFVENDLQAFAAKAIELYTEENKWKTAQQAGVEVINQRFQKDFWSPKLIDNIFWLTTHLKSNRHHNFTGAMLHHQTLLAAKYLSKYIQAKNRAD